MKQRILRQRFLPQKHRDLEYEGYTLITNVKKKRARVLLKENERFDRDIVWCQKNKQHSFTSCYHNWSSLCFTKRGFPFVFAPKILQTTQNLTLVCLWCGRKVGRSVYDHAIAKFSRTGSLPHFLNHGAPLRALHERELRYEPTQFVWYQICVSQFL